MQSILQQYEAGLLSPGEALSSLMNLYLHDRTNEEALGNICLVITDLNRIERKKADEFWAKQGV